MAITVLVKGNDERLDAGNQHHRCHGGKRRVVFRLLLSMEGVTNRDARASEYAKYFKIRSRENAAYDLVYIH